MIGPDASDHQLAKLREDVAADPRGWIAQPVVPLSTSPTLVEGELVPRHIDLRPFAVNDGNRIWVMPGGLTRVALVEGSLVVNSSQGGGSKDTWVVTDGAAPVELPVAEPETRRARRLTCRSRPVGPSSVRRSNNSNNSSPGREARRAEPDRRVAVLDRTADRARRGRVAHARCLGAPLAGGLVGQ